MLTEQREREIAEIIGVEWYDDGERVTVITADDMLAWLRGQGVTIVYKQHPAAGGVLEVDGTLRIVDHRLPWFATDPAGAFYASLLDALESAVRAVASRNAGSPAP